MERSHSVIHLSGSCQNGGAARSAYRIHQSLRNSKYDSIFRARDLPPETDSSAISDQFHNNKSLIKRLKIRYFSKKESITYKGAIEETTGLRSYATIPYGILHEETIRKAKIIHLHWVARHFMSIEEIGKIRQPTVWTLHDMWPFCGAEHYAVSNQYKDSYSESSRPDKDRGPDLNRKTWLRKKKAWTKPIHIIATSRWMAECAKSSSLMNEWPISIIPCPINLETWKPAEQHEARKILNLPANRKILVVAADDQFTNYAKGGDLLLESLSKITHSFNPILLILGNNTVSREIFPPQIEPHYLGKLSDTLSMRIAYSAADVVIVPSRLEAFGQVASEAQACGRPVAAFGACGLLDIVEHEKTGHLAKPLEPDSLARSIEWIISKPDRWNALCHNARLRAESLWSYKNISAMHIELYERILQETTTQGRK